MEKVLAKERGQNHLIKTQIMVYPATAPSHAEYESYELFGQGDYALSMRGEKQSKGRFGMHDSSNLSARN